MSIPILCKPDVTERCIIELQGQLICNEGLEQALLGFMCINEEGNPVLRIEKHVLIGKFEKLPNPIAILRVGMGAARQELWKSIYYCGTEWSQYQEIFRISWDFTNLDEHIFARDGALFKALEEGKYVYFFGTTEPQLVPRVPGEEESEDEDAGWTSFERSSVTYDFRQKQEEKVKKALVKKEEKEESGEVDETQAKPIFIPVVFAVVSDIPLPEKLGVKSVQMEEMKVMDMRELRMSWEKKHPLSFSCDALDENPDFKKSKSRKRRYARGSKKHIGDNWNLFLLTCSQRSRAMRLRGTDEDRVRIYDYCLPYIFVPKLNKKPEGLKEGTMMEIAFKKDDKEIKGILFDWDYDKMEDFLADAKVDFKLDDETLEELKKETERQVKEEKERREKIIEAHKEKLAKIPLEEKKALDEMEIFKFYPSYHAYDLSGLTSSPIVNRYYDIASQIRNDSADDGTSYYLSANYYLSSFENQPPDRISSDTSPTHGTAVASISIGNDGICGLGIAPDATFAGRNLTSVPSTTTEDLQHAQCGECEYVDIFSHSWNSVLSSGDFTLKTINSSIKSAMNTCLFSTGRDGKGTLFVRSSGNDGQSASANTLLYEDVYMYSVVVGAVAPNVPSTTTEDLQHAQCGECEYVDIFSHSWNSVLSSGDFTLKTINSSIKSAMNTCLFSTGRDGKGTLFVRSSGNDGQSASANTLLYEDVYMYSVVVVASISIGNDGICGLGIAPDATFAGRNLTSVPSTTTEDLQHAQCGECEYVDIFSHSWNSVLSSGDFTLKTINSSIKSAMNTCLFSTGRDGKGTLFVRSSGNDGQSASANTLLYEDVYMYSVVVGAVAPNGVITDYSTPGENVTVCAPSEGSVLDGCSLDEDTAGIQAAKALYLGDSTDSGYSDSSESCITFGGTSAAAPQVSGVLALLLSKYGAISDSNSSHDISVRDIFRGLAHSSYRIDADSSTWSVNANGIAYSSSYGFGMIRAGDLIDYFENIMDNNVDKYDQIKLLGEPDVLTKVINSSSGQNLSISMSTDSMGSNLYLDVTESLDIEYVSLSLEIALEEEAKDNSLALEYLSFTVISPSGTVSEIISGRASAELTQETSVVTLSNMFSLRMYGEDSRGRWVVRVECGCDSKCSDALGSASSLSLVTVSSISLSLYGRLNSSQTQKVLQPDLGSTLVLGKEFSIRVTETFASVDDSTDVSLSANVLHRNDTKNNINNISDCSLVEPMGTDVSYQVYLVLGSADETYSVTGQAASLLGSVDLDSSSGAITIASFSVPSILSSILFPDESQVRLLFKNSETSAFFLSSVVTLSRNTSDKCYSVCSRGFCSFDVDAYASGDYSDDDDSNDDDNNNDYNDEKDIWERIIVFMNKDVSLGVFTLKMWIVCIIAFVFIFLIPLFCCCLCCGSGKKKKQKKGAGKRNQKVKVSPRQQALQGKKMVSVRRSPLSHHLSSPQYISTDSAGRRASIAIQYEAGHRRASHISPVRRASHISPLSTVSKKATLSVSPADRSRRPSMLETSFSSPQLLPLPSSHSSALLSRRASVVVTNDGCMYLIDEPSISPVREEKKMRHAKDSGHRRSRRASHSRPSPSPTLDVDPGIQLLDPKMNYSDKSYTGHHRRRRRSIVHE
ncbi:hypothetical protein ADUPG1_009581 [Aduncisulcus paluster]|uniref:P/Homo B domain-containing protein n=1 Tax=Aduncisulcus paluster TaxID=2918883 RepID=A0ABQ5KW50_9EUKA|nr:hypothetical protein ADUPG1_009581 [Aduncisulcus paluster]